MGILALGADERVAEVTFTANTLNVTMKDGRTITVPLTWYPRLLQATPKQRKHWKISGGGYGIHWPELDEDLSTEGLLRGAPAPQMKAAKKAVRTVRSASGSGWDNKVGGKVESHHRTQAGAIEKARKLASDLGTEPNLHGRRRVIRDSQSGRFRDSDKKEA
jgi:hypothetical protein